jgi:hypothetical protein
MKITINELKTLVRKAIRQINEAPFAGVEPMVASRTDVGRYKDWMERETGMNADPKAIDKFHRTSLFQKKAEWAFAGFNIPIYIIPNVGEYYLNYSNNDSRVQFFSKEKLKKIVEKSNSQIDLQKVFSNLDAGACYILSSINFLAKGGLPTPWMIIHAILDNGQGEDSISNYNLPPGLEKIYEISQDIYFMIEDGELIFEKDQERTNAKNLGEAQDTGDLVAEILTQEIATKSGLQIKMLGNEQDEIWQNVLDKIKSVNMKKLMEDSIKGKIIMVANTLE